MFPSSNASDAHPSHHSSYRRRARCGSSLSGPRPRTPSGRTTRARRQGGTAGDPSRGDVSTALPASSSPLSYEHIPSSARAARFASAAAGPPRSSPNMDARAVSSSSCAARSSSRARRRRFRRFRRLRRRRRRRSCRASDESRTLANCDTSARSSSCSHGVSMRPGIELTAFSSRSTRVRPRAQHHPAEQREHQRHQARPRVRRDGMA